MPESGRDNHHVKLDVEFVHLMNARDIMLNVNSEEIFSGEDMASFTDKDFLAMI